MEEKVDLKYDEIKKRDLFNNIISLEDQKDPIKNMSNFDFLPILFNDLKVSTFGNSLENPFYKLYEISINENLSWEDRTQAIRYMQRIPHINCNEYCIKATIKLIDDKRYHIDNRYFFFSNNEKLIKLNYEIVNASHIHFFNNYDYPLLYKILSAQYLLTTIPLCEKDLEKVQLYLYNICINENVEINYRAECADILDRSGFGNMKEKGKEIIEKLSLLDLGEISKLKTIYNNLQNVHDSSITKSIMENIKLLIKESLSLNINVNTGDIYEYIKENVKEKEYIDICVSILERILIDSSRYEGKTITELLCIVWYKILNSKYKIELQKRFIEELIDMYNTCSSGLISRLINIFSGFDDIYLKPILISYKEQLKSNIFARYTFILQKLCSEEQRNNILNEIVGNNKENIDEFLISYSLKDELEEEFVESGYISKDEFEISFTKYENEFFGKK